MLADALMFSIGFHPRLNRCPTAKEKSTWASQVADGWRIQTLDFQGLVQFFGEGNGHSACFPTGRRGAKDDVYTAIMTLDFDSGISPREVLYEFPYNHILVHSSRSVPEHPRFHIMLPMQNHVTSSYVYKELWSRLDLPADGSSGSMVRFYYGGTDMTYKDNGFFLNPANFFIEPPPPPVQYAPYEETGSIVDDWRQTLIGSGWCEVRSSGDGSLWRRPGKDSGVSGQFFGDASLFHCYTSSAPPLQAGRSYRPITLFAELCCGGDFGKAREESLNLVLPADWPHLCIPPEWVELFLPLGS